MKHILAVDVFSHQLLGICEGNISIGKMCTRELQSFKMGSRSKVNAGKWKIWHKLLVKTLNKSTNIITEK